MACPLEMAMALHYHCIAGPYAAKDPNHATSSAVRDYHDKFVSCGLLVDLGYDSENWYHGSRYKATDRLHAWVDLLSKVPLPVMKWVHPSEAGPNA